LWRHSIAVSVAAEGLVGELKLKTAEEIFTAALLHDVGKLVMGELVREDIRKLDAALEQGISYEAAENIVFGTNHAEVGARVLETWSLPQSIISAVRWHHQPDSAGQTDTMLEIVHVANVLCLMIGCGIGREGLQYQLSGEVTARLGLSSQHLEKVASQTLQWVDELEGVFG
jgi:putative nucleotidyltransferase with HDIG domain